MHITELYFFTLPTSVHCTGVNAFKGTINIKKPVPVAARSKAWFCEIVGSNPTGGMDVCLF